MNKTRFDKFDLQELYGLSMYISSLIKTMEPTLDKAKKDNMKVPGLDIFIMEQKKLYNDVQATIAKKFTGELINMCKGYDMEEPNDSQNDI